MLNILFIEPNDPSIKTLEAATCLTAVAPAIFGTSVLRMLLERQLEAGHVAQFLDLTGQDVYSPEEMACFEAKGYHVPHRSGKNAVAFTTLTNM